MSLSTSQWCRGGDQKGTLIRHVRRGGLAALPVLPLPVTVIEPAFLAPLVAAVSTALLAATIVLTAGFAAITLPAVAVGADEEDGLAVRSDTRPLPQRCLAVNRRHRGRRRGWTTTARLCQVGTLLRCT